MNTIHYFPADFKWGTATAAHQVEGNNTNNQWWSWELMPGHIQNGDRSGNACDWWRGADADFDRMVELGLTGHRLSVEWSRIEPREGQFDSSAIDHYRNMLLGLRQRGIEPMVTLHHFTNPLWLELKGGWEHTHVVVPLFKRFVTKVVQAMGDLCDLWCTINEPNVYAVEGYLGDGSHPPGATNQLDRAMTVVCNLLLGHAVAYETLHENQQLARVGLAHHMRLFQPLRHGNVADTLAAWLQDSAFNQGVLTALLKGRWNLWLSRGRVPGARALHHTLDWIGLNYYTRQSTQFDLSNPGMLFGKQVDTPDATKSDFDYGEIYPEGILPLLNRLSHARLPVYITENGLPDADDNKRAAFIIRQLRAIWTAVQFQPIQGYYHWTLVDNFEWSEGWRMKFGLYSMDPVTQVRITRPSASTYRDIVRSNSISSDIVCAHAPELLPLLFPGM